MQKNGLPVHREAVLDKARDICRAKYDVTRSTGFVTIRWVSCFLKRHPDLSLRDSLVIKRAWNEVSIESLREFFNGYVKHIIERNASPDRVFNMVETGYSQKSRQTKVILVKGLRTCEACPQIAASTSTSSRARQRRALFAHRCT